MKKWIFVSLASIAAINLQAAWGLGDALKAVDNAANQVKEAGAVAQNTVTYTPQKRYEIKKECLKQLNDAMNSDAISFSSRREISTWLDSAIDTVNSPETETELKSTFQQKLEAAKSGQNKPTQSQSKTVPQNSQTAVANSSSQSEKKYGSYEQREIKEDCVKQANDAKHAGEIDAMTFGSLESWLSCNSYNINSAEDEAKYRSTFKQKLETAKAQCGVEKEFNAIYEECKTIVTSLDDKAETDKFFAFFHKGGKGGKGEQAGQSVSLDEAKAYRDELVAKKKTADAAKADEEERRNYAKSIQGLDRQLAMEIDKGISYPCVDQKQLKKEVDEFFEGIDWHDCVNLPTKEEVEALKAKVSKAIEDFKIAKEKSDGLENELNVQLKMSVRYGIMQDSESRNKGSEFSHIKEKSPLAEYVSKMEECVTELKAKIEPIAEKIAAREKRLENLRKVIKEYDNDGLKKDNWKIVKAAVSPATQADLAEVLRDDRAKAIINGEERPDELWYWAAPCITDQAVLKDLLVDNDDWIRNFKRDGVLKWTQAEAYYEMYKNVTDQDLLVKLLGVKEISFDGWGIDSYGARDRAVIAQLDAKHLNQFSKKRESRRKAVKGQTIDFKGFYLGMSRFDYELMLQTEAKGIGKNGGEFGRFGVGPMSDLWFGAEARLKYLGVKKDGLTGLAELVNKYIPGGLDSTGDVKVGGKAEQNHDPSNPEITVKTWWYVNVPQFKCVIRMYDSGGINIYTTDEMDKVELDFSKAEK